MSTSDKMLQLNGTIVPGPAMDVSRAAIKATLAGGGTLVAMEHYITNPAATQPALRATNYILALIDFEASAVGDMLPTSVPGNLTMIERFVPNLLADPANGMTVDMINQVMALITPPIPWWQANGFQGPVLVSDLITAGNLF
jgi:hypothetical protein